MEAGEIPNANRFSGFADLYDTTRPSPPDRVGALLARYASAAAPTVVDLGSGTGLSSRWASRWAAAVIGIEPNADMRARAVADRVGTVEYREGFANRTGLTDSVADIVVAVQAMHWMEPTSTLAEVARILRPGGVFAVIDADWPPVSGLPAAEAAWVAVHRRIRVFEARAARHETGAALRRPIDEDDPALVDEDPGDPHRNRAMPGGVRSWSKRDHLERIRQSGAFAFARELVCDEVAEGGSHRFVALMRSQGSYQGLLRLGVTDDDLGVPAFEAIVDEAFAGSAASPTLGFCWRVRLGCTADTSQTMSGAYSLQRPGTRTHRTSICRPS